MSGKPVQKYPLQAAPKAGDNLVSVAVRIVTNEGILSAYSGLTAALLRQLTYSMARFGVYEQLKEYFTERAHHDLNGGQLLGCSIVAGAVGSIVGNPADVVNVRMQNDKSLPPELQRNYRNALDGLYKVVKYEGVNSLFRGWGPNIVRGVLMTSSQVVSYDLAKRFLVGTLDFDPTTKTTHFSASLIASLVATTICSPADVIKTRVMNASTKGESPIRILVDSVKKEGVRFMFRGWLPSFVRLGPHTIITFIGMEQLRKWRIGMSN
ncbi:DEKNAAC104105 [Brettanomyces naardenensis]|uniref:DEKNAAC104105 n=1 Tax=Brettanomyces naardenensis TaxID=13370 RepID=A0A448YPS7_BRENA|nr:DEKNAAC104105 [Brettanomyces naardenensis]